METWENATDENDIHREAMRKLPLAADAESANRTEALTDLKFGNGDQWPVDVQRDRDTDGRPCLTINVTDAMVRKVCNALRENRPRIKVHPVGGDADVQIAKVYDGLIRHIESASGADYAYDCGVESAVRGGWGYWRVNSKHVSETSFDQDLTIEAIPNPFTVYMDPASRAPDGSDMAWCIVSDWMRRDAFQEKFGREGPSYSRIKSMVSAFSFQGVGDQINDWSRKEEVRLAEYWRIVPKRDDLYMLSNGLTEFGSDLDRAKLKEFGLEIATRNGKPITRQVMRKSVEWYLLDGSGVIESRKWPGKWIPIIPCYGRSLDLNGKIVRKGMIRDLRDPARMVNYSETSKTEVYALQPKAPWMGAKGFMGDDQSAWRDSNRKPIVALEYTPIQNPDGSMAPPPMRQNPPPVAGGFQEWSQSGMSNFLVVAGMPNEPDADKKGEVISGIAIHKRQGLADISHFDFYDNQTRSLRHTGNILVDLIPKFYDTQRMQRIINPDGTPDQVMINERAEGKIKNDLTVGRYDVVIDTGPGYQTKREEAAGAMLELLGTPLGEMTAKVAGDVVVRSLDFPDSDLIADRMAAMIPGAQTDKNSDLPEKAQIMIAGLQQQLADANKKSMALELELQAKHGLEQMRQQAETERLKIREQGEDRRAGLKSNTEIQKTHIDAVTRHDVAEIGVAGRILDTHAGAMHAKELEKEVSQEAESAEKRPE